MGDRKQAISSNLQTQWQDHFHMRDQTWKVLQSSVLFFVGVVGLQIEQVDSVILGLAYVALCLTSGLGVVIALHHRRRQKEKFEIIAAHERALGLDKLAGPVLEKARERWMGRINTSTYIVAMQASLCAVSACLLGRLLLSR
jgi:disulfide bond formation protein DsbB